MDTKQYPKQKHVEKTTKDGRRIFAFNFPHPLDAINLIATDRYKIVKDHFNGVEIFAYFFPEDADLIQTYIEHTKHYLKLYENADQQVSLQEIFHRGKLLAHRILHAHLYRFSVRRW